jgi:para-hydroxybenzoate--polyprenyltransferase, mitochondrial
MRGVGCTVNDILDKKIDAKVERTKLRPIASDQISTPKALAFLALQSSLALSILLKFDLNRYITVNNYIERMFTHFAFIT